jgi:hypothetical protein
VKEDLRITEDEKEAFQRELAQADSDFDQMDSSKANVTQVSICCVVAGKAKSLIRCLPGC